MTQRQEEKLPDGRVRITVTPNPELQVSHGAVELGPKEYAAYRRWRDSRGDAIQTYLPDLDDDTRELLLTGLSPETWTQVFGGGPE